MKIWRSLSLCTLAGAVLCSTSLAQSAGPAVRIRGPIDDSQLTALRGSLNPAAIGAADRGPVSASLPMTGLTLILSRSSQEQAAFDAFVAGQYDQGSPNYHQWLSPQQAGQRFGPSQADISTISAWLAGHGFIVKSVGADGMTIQFSGTAGQVESTFHTEIHNLTVKGKAHFANVTDAQIPSALAPVVAGIKGLRNFYPHPMHRMGAKVQFNPDAHEWVKLQATSGVGLTPGALLKRAPAASADSASSPQPDYGYPIPNSGTPVMMEEDVAPYDFAKIYNLPSGWPTSTNGSGQIITIIGTSDIVPTDVANFKSAFGLPAGTAPVIVHGPDGDPGICSGSTNACSGGDLDENSLDVEWSGAVAPGAQIVLVTDAYNSQTNPTNDPIYDGAQWAIDNAYVPGSAVYGSRILSLSYGECELFNGTASNVAYYNLWQTAASAGIAVFAAAGDSGSPSCDDGGDSEGNPYEAQYGLSVSGLASSPWDTAVGGTDFSWCQPTLITSGASAGNTQGCSSTNASTYWNTSNSSTTQASAKGYVPETPWNDTCENPINAAYLESAASFLGAGTYSTPEEACNFVYSQSVSLYFNNSGQSQNPALMQYVDTVGGSGGASSCVVNNADSDSTSPSCTAGSTSTGSSYGNITLANDGWPKPSWQTGPGVPADGVRDLPDVSFFAGDGNLDSATLICVSNDGAKCTAISETGSTNTSDTGGAEEVGGTSVGTPEMAGVMALINQKAGSAQGSPNPEFYTLAASQNYSECSAETVTSSSCYFQDIDNGPSGYSSPQTNSMPCNYEGKDIEGGATYEGGGQWGESQGYEGTASPNCNVVNSGDSVGTLSGYSSATGYDQATGLGSLNIANVLGGAWTAVSGTAAATVSVLPSGTSLNSNQTLNVSVTVSGSGATPTGDLTLYASSAGAACSSYGSGCYSSTVLLSSGAATFTVPINTFDASGTVTFTAAYSGDSNYAAASGASAGVAVTYIPVTVSEAAIASPAAVSPGGTANATVTVSSNSGYAGTITLTCVLTGEPNGAANVPSCSPSGSIVLSATKTSGYATLTVATTAPTTQNSGGGLASTKGKGLLGAGGGAVLAFLVFFGVPARRKSWRALLGAVVLLVTLGSLAACGSNQVGNGGGTTTVPGTTPGAYTFTVTPQGSPAPSGSPSPQTFTVTVS